MKSDMEPYYEALKSSGLKGSELIGAAHILRDLEKDPLNPVDYKSVSIAINEARRAR